MNDKKQVTPSQHIESWKLAVKLLVGSLTIFFLSGIVGYIVIQQQHITLRYANKFSVPISLWLSTAALIVVSYAMQRATSVVRREQLPQLKRFMLMSIAGAVVFSVFQLVGMIDVLQDYLKVKASESQGMGGIAFALIATHALHVGFGLLWLAIVARKVYSQSYDHEYHLGLTLCTYYWHFLDFVWVVMFFVFLGTNFVP